MSVRDIPREVIDALGFPPTEQQWNAISAPLERVAIIAGAGSGKTAVMAARVVWLSLQGLNPSSVLALTFTNKAAQELARRVRIACGSLKLPEGDEATVLTYHAFAARLLDEQGLRIGIERGQMLLSAAQQWQLATSLLAERTFEHLQVRTIPAIVQKVIDLSDHCANHLVDPANLERYSETFARSLKPRAVADREAIETAWERVELSNLVRAYQQRKRELGVMDYGDQILHAVRLLIEHPDVGAGYREQFGAVLLDEYQDTNAAQARLLELLFPAPHPVMCVGDPDQNIYAWRGASLHNILRFASQHTSLPLTVNFRSGSRILDAANAIIERVPAERRAPDKFMEPSGRLGQGRVAAFTAEDQTDEARRIAGLIEEQRANGVPLSEIAVLCRKKKMMPPILAALREHRIPAEVVDLGGLLQIPEIVEIVAWLRFLNDASDNISLARILQNPRWRIGYRDLVALARWSARHNKSLRIELNESEHPSDVAFVLAESLARLDEIEGLSAQARVRLRQFQSLHGSLCGVVNAPLPALVEEIAEQTGMMRELETVSFERGARRNVVNFIALASSFAPMSGEPSLPAFVDYLACAYEVEEAFEQAQPSDEGAVKIMTIHKAKGLEWDVVFVPALADSRRSHYFPDTSRQPNEVSQPQTLPFALRSDAEALPAFDGNLRRFKEELTARGLEEERRLCYVALTRARKMLVLSSAHWYDGPKEPFDPSMFFNELAMTCEPLHKAGRPESSPLIEQRAQLVIDWPPHARTLPDDVVQPCKDIDSAIASLSVSDREELERQVASNVARIAALEHRDVLRAEAPRVQSVSAVIECVRSPRQYWDRYVRPIPQKQAAAARLGSDVHRLIEILSRGDHQASGFEAGPDAGPEAGPETGSDTGPDTGPLLRAWLASRFSKQTPIAVEKPVVMFVDGVAISGRIDAIFEDENAGIEIVDYKTGSSTNRDQEIDQLALYARALCEIEGFDPRRVRTTYVYLAENIEQAGGSATDPIVLPAPLLERPSAP